MVLKKLKIALLLLLTQQVAAQNASLAGKVIDNGQAIPSATITILGTSIKTLTDSLGFYSLTNIQAGNYNITASCQGYQNDTKKIIIQKNQHISLNFELKSNSSILDPVVVTGTKTFKRKTQSPVIVNILNSSTLDNLQVCNLSEGLKFQPGLRIETDCQTCNYTQLRINGLQGGYSQILINGRPIFSPLMGLYGMEQLPVNMIEKIEIIRGGGSSLYGSSAIGGTVNVITKLPSKNGYQINTFYQNTHRQANDINLNGNATLVNHKKNTGITFFISKRNRDYYDANADNFSEIPKMENTSLGFNSFYQFSPNQKLEISVSNLNEYRYGGQMTSKPAYLAQQAEERKHNIWIASADYQINFNNNKSAFIIYSAFQNTKRNHYTGIFPDSAIEIQNQLQNPPYGTSNNTTVQGGFQLNHTLNHFFKTRNILTLGTEFISDKVFDNIPTYQYLVNQHTMDWGTFIQSDWDIAKKINLLSGIRVDKHNLLNMPVISPRLALLYKHNTSTQFRLSYGTGFRAPQAFDTDLHIAFAGGGVSRVQLAPKLKQENSQSLSASVNFDKANKKWIAGYTLEGFYTQLANAFILQNIGQDNFGQIFQKTNGQKATVQGLTIELRANYSKKAQLETAFTMQQSQFQNPVQNIQGLEPSRQFLRTPNHYGFANLSITPNKQWNININYVHTGPMQLAHFAGAINHTQDRMVQTKSFSEINTKITHTIHAHQYQNDLEIYAGIKNILNAYQTDFDQGKNRDSNYIYGPNLPRTLFIGLKIKMD